MPHEMSSDLPKGPKASFYLPFLGSGPMQDGEIDELTIQAAFAKTFRSMLHLRACGDCQERCPNE